MTRSMIVAAVLGLAALAGPAFAQSASDGTSSVTIQRGDLDLTGRPGAAEMLARIRAAAERVCDSGDIRPLGRRVAFEHCRAGAISHAVDRLGAPMVASLAGRSAIVIAGR